MVVVTVAGCGGRPAPIGGAPALTVAPVDALPAPTAAQPGGPGAFLLQPYDKVRVEVFGVEELQRTLAVDGDGRVSFPLIGELQASGKTPAELGREIAGALRSRNQVRNPDVSVNVVEVPGRTVTVDGQVNRPGAFPVYQSTTLMRAVALAGGTNQYARTDDVVLFRTVGDQRYVGLYNLGAIRRGNYSDPQIYNEDIVIVGESKQRRLLETVIQGASLVTTPLILLFQR